MECSKQQAEATTNSLEGSPEPQSLRVPSDKVSGADVHDRKYNTNKKARLPRSRWKQKVRLAL